MSVDAMRLRLVSVEMRDGRVRAKQKKCIAMPQTQMYELVIHAVEFLA